MLLSQHCITSAYNVYLYFTTNDIPVELIVAIAYKVDLTIGHSKNLCHSFGPCFFPPKAVIVIISMGSVTSNGYQQEIP